jgi:hypothetical protein
VFHEAQILNVIRLVILHSPTDAGFRCTRPEEFHLLIRALLGDVPVPVEFEN